MDETRKCGRCGKLREPESFVGAGGKPVSSCEPCRASSREHNRASRAAGGPELVRAMNLWAKYRIRPEMYDRLRGAQDYRCAVCGIREDEIPAPRSGRPRMDGKPTAEAFRLVVDHCHGSGAVRGLLCGGCNSALGHFRDSVEALRRAVDYLGRPPLTPPRDPADFKA